VQQNVGQTREARFDLQVIKTQRPTRLAIRLTTAHSQAFPSQAQAMTYDFLIESYESERVKVVSVWSEFRDGDLTVRPRKDDSRGRSVQEHMVHQCVSEDAWFRNMLGIDVGAPPLPELETRLEFMKRYAEDSGKRLQRLRQTDECWWESLSPFFNVQRTRAWVMTRRLTHTSHHRGQQMAMLRMLGRDLHSNYGPTADTGGLMQNNAPTIYAYVSLEALLEGESRGGAKSALPGRLGAMRSAVTERAMTS
jgi:uncharacterized damage-inducible protein DinB